MMLVHSLERKTITLGIQVYQLWNTAMLTVVDGPLERIGVTDTSNVDHNNNLVQSIQDVTLTHHILNMKIGTWTSDCSLARLVSM